MNGKFLTATALAATMTFGAIAPALADGAASTRNILIGGAAAAVLITNYNHKKREKQEQEREQARRQAYFQNHYHGNESTYRSWYYRNYGVWPAN